MTVPPTTRHYEEPPMLPTWQYLNLLSLSGWLEGHQLDLSELQLLCLLEDGVLHRLQQVDLWHHRVVQHQCTLRHGGQISTYTENIHADSMSNTSTLSGTASARYARTFFRHVIPLRVRETGASWAGFY